MVVMSCAACMLTNMRLPMCLCRRLVPDPRRQFQIFPLFLLENVHASVTLTICLLIFLVVCPQRRTRGMVTKRA